MSHVIAAPEIMTSAATDLRNIGSSLSAAHAAALAPTTGVLDAAEVSDGTDQLRTLLVGYASILETIDNAPAVLWANLERPRILHWLRFPAVRGLVSALLVRHVSRCISALKRSGARRVAVADDALGPRRDLKMLEKFEQSLPTDVRMAVIAPLAMVGLLFGAFIFAKVVINSPDSQLLGDLTTAAFTLDRGAALRAFAKDRADLVVCVGTAMILVWSAALIIAPLLPAFSVKRRLLRPLAELELRGFAALGCRRVQDLELDLVAQLLGIAPVAFIAAGSVWFGAFGSSSERARFGVDHVATNLLYAVLVCLAALAGVYQRRRYAARREEAARRHTPIMRVALWITRVALWLVSAFAVFMLIIVVS